MMFQTGKFLVDKWELIHNGRWDNYGFKTSDIVDISA